MDSAVGLVELPPPAGGWNDCVKLEHAARAAEKAPIRASREDLTSFTFQMTARGMARFTTIKVKEPASSVSHGRDYGAIAPAKFACAAERNSSAVICRQLVTLLRQVQ